MPKLAASLGITLDIVLHTHRFCKKMDEILTAYEQCDEETETHLKELEDLFKKEEFVPHCQSVPTRGN